MIVVQLWKNWLMIFVGEIFILKLKHSFYGLVRQRHRGIKFCARAYYRQSLENEERLKKKNIEWTVSSFQCTKYHTWEYKKIRQTSLKSLTFERVYFWIRHDMPQLRVTSGRCQYKMLSRWRELKESNTRSRGWSSHGHHTDRWSDWWM